MLKICALARLEVKEHERGCPLSDASKVKQSKGVEREMDGRKVW